VKKRGFDYLKKVVILCRWIQVDGEGRLVGTTPCCLCYWHVDNKLQLVGCENCQATATPQLLFTNFQSVAKSAFTDLQWVGKGFTDPLASVPTDCELQISSFTDTWSDVIQNFLLKKGCAPDLSPQPQTHAQVIFV
jgi:hypothetical protein